MLGNTAMSPHGWFVAALTFVAILVITGGGMFWYFLHDARTRASLVPPNMPEPPGRSHALVGAEPPLRETRQQDQPPHTHLASPWAQLDTRKTDQG